MKGIQGEQHTFKIDQHSHVIATDKKDGGMIRSQSVETLLLYEILKMLKVQWRQ